MNFLAKYAKRRVIGGAVTAERAEGLKLALVCVILPNPKNRAKIAV